MPDTQQPDDDRKDGRPAETPAEADEQSEAFGSEDAATAGQYGPTADFGDG